MPDSTSDQPDGEERSLWQRPTVVASGGFLAAVVVLGLVVLTTGGGGNSADEKPGPGASPSATSQPHDSGGSCPHLPDTSQKVPSSAPHGVHWGIEDTFALPSSRAAGPARTGDGMARCYAHTPTGALLASAQISTRYTFSADWRKVTDHQTIGPGKDKYLKQRAKAGDERPEADEHGQLAGFKFTTYDSSTAVVQHVYRFDGGQLQTASVTVKWVNGDWKLEIPASPSPPSAVSSMAGYITWGGV